MKTSIQMFYAQLLLFLDIYFYAKNEHDPRISSGDITDKTLCNNTESKGAFKTFLIGPKCPTIHSRPFQFLKTYQTVQDVLNRLSTNLHLPRQAKPHTSKVRILASPFL